MKTMVTILLAAGALMAADDGNGLGFAAGQLSGIGFSYRHLAERYGFQITFGVLSLKENGDSRPQTVRGEYDPSKFIPPVDTNPYSYNARDFHANVGLMLMQVLHTAKRSRLYVFTGLSWRRTVNTYVEQYYGYRIIDSSTWEYGPVGKEKKRSDVETTGYVGAGIGMEFKITENIRIALEWPLTYSSEGDLVMYIPQAGLHYFF